MPHITFIHGISNKFEEKGLINIWRDSLWGDALGNDDAVDLNSSRITTSMATDVL